MSALSETRNCRNTEMATRYLSNSIGFCVLGDQMRKKANQAWSRQGLLIPAARKNLSLSAGGFLFWIQDDIWVPGWFQRGEKLPENGRDRLVFKKDSQILEITANFPDKDYDIPEEILGFADAGGEKSIEWKKNEIIFRHCKFDKINGLKWIIISISFEIKK